MSAGTEQQPVAAPRARKPERARRRVGLGVAALHLGALWAFAVVQPLFDLLGGQAQFFVARGSTAADIVVFAVGLTVVPPALMAGAVWLAGRVRPAFGWWLHVALVGALAAAILLPPLGGLMGGAAVSLAVALALGAALVAAYVRAAALRAFVSVLSPAPLLFLVLFLAFSPVAELVLPAGGAVAVAGSGSSDTPVVVVVFDELPTTTLLDARGRVDAGRFPAFASVAADATWYRDATTVAGRTTEALPALLTGRRPRQDELPTARHHPRSLFTLLGRSHRLAVVEPITDVCPQDLCSEARPGMGRRLRSLASDLRVVSAHLLLPDDLRDGLPPIDQDWQGFAGDDETPERVTVHQRIELRRGVGRALAHDDPAGAFARIERAVDRSGSQPPLLFLHTSLPHAPWRFLPDGRRYAEQVTTIPGLVEGEWVGAQWLADQGFQRHLLQTQYADRLLGRLLRRLRASGLYERALVVVTADHGVSFWRGDRRRKPTDGNLADVASVPLFIKAPGQREPRVERGAVRTIDLLPTIARELGLRLQGPV
ncbi:MAG: sulfatase-like hydrolase/transferase, partial [Solirubrobacteraceae bacterium]